MYKEKIKSVVKDGKEIAGYKYGWFIYSNEADYLRKFLRENKGSIYKEETLKDMVNRAYFKKFLKK